MYTVGVVPHDHEVLRCGLKLCKPPDGLIAVDDAVRVGILRNTPDALDRRVLYQGFDLIHVRARRGHIDGDQLCAEALRYAEVPVIARGRAQEFYLVQFAPGFLAVQQAVGIGLGDGVVHQVQAGVASYEAFLRPAAENIGKERFCARQPGKAAVVAHIHSVRAAVCRIGQDAQNPADEIQLFLSRLSAGHIQFQALGLQGLIF